VARRTENYAVINGIRAAVLDMPHVMGAHCFAELMLCSTGLAKRGDFGSTTRAPVLLPLERLLLGLPGKFIGPRHASML
jgi:hypothetical protein